VLAKLTGEIEVKLEILEKFYVICDNSYSAQGKILCDRNKGN